DGDWEYTAGVALALRAAVHHGSGDRQRVRGGSRRSPPLGARRDRPRPLHHHAAREFLVKPPHPGHGADIVYRSGRARGAGEGGGMNRTMFRKALSSLFVLSCACAVIIALIPLAFILFFVVTQGIRAVNVEFFTHLPQPVGEQGGGMANAIAGTLLLSGRAALM